MVTKTLRNPTDQARSATLPCASQLRQRNNFDIPGQFVGLPPWIRDVEMIQLQIGQGDPHGWSERGGIRSLALDPDTPSFLEEQQIEFGAVIGSPVVGFIGLQSLEDLLDCVTLP